MKEIIRFIGENIFFTNKSNPKLRAVKIICSLLIIAVFFAGCYYTFSYIIHKHQDRAVAAFIVEEPEEAYTPSAACFSNEEHPYELDGIQAFLKSVNTDKLEITIGNINDFDVTLLSVQDEKGKYVYGFTQDALLKATQGEVIYYTYTFDNIDENLSDIYVYYMYNDGIARRVSLIPYKSIDDDIHFGIDIRTQDNTDEFDYIQISDNDVVFIGQDIVIDKPLFIPPGKRLKVHPGQNIDIVNKAYIFIRSSIQAVGTQNDRIFFVSSDGTGQGVYVCQTDARSSMQYVTFDGLDTPSSGIWGLTGAVTFYESDVDIDNCQFINNVCEDALNIVRSNFNVTNCLFKNTFADAFDSDFCSGLMENCVFKNTGNDGVDVSMTALSLIAAEFYEIGDKAISGGENSVLDIEDILITSAAIGIASKDVSMIKGRDIVISNAKIALTMYQKKPEFGPATIDIEDVAMLGDIDLDYLIQKDSELYIDNKLITPRSSAKESLLFEKMINGEPIQ